MCVGVSRVSHEAAIFSLEPRQLHSKLVMWLKWRHPLSSIQAIYEGARNTTVRSARARLAVLPVHRLEKFSEGLRSTVKQLLPAEPSVRTACC